MDPGKDTLYARWLAGELTEAEQQQLLHREEVDELERIIESADQLQLPKYDAEAAYSQFRKKHPSKKVKVRSISPRWWMGVAAGLALLVLALTFFGNRTQEASASFADNTTHTLPDQSTIVLNDGSSIRYQKGNWEGERVVQLTGEALFSVQKGSSFTVQTVNGTVEVLGTQFNVRAWGNKLHVECYEGKVQVTSHQQETILTPNESVNVVKGTMQEKQLITHQQPLWSTGSSRFYEENINQVFAELERQYNIQVEVPMMNGAFTGVFPHNDLESALKNICLPKQLKYEINENGNFVIISE